MIFLDDKPYRIISHLKSDDENIKMLYWLIDLSVSSFRFLNLSLPDLSEAYLDGRLTACVDNEEYPTPILKDGDKDLTDHRYRCVSDYVNSLYPDYTVLAKRGRGKDTDALEHLAKSCRLTTKRMRSLILRFLQYGCTYYALVDGRTIRAMGSDGKSYSNGEVRGRKRHGVSNMVENDDKLIAYYEEAFSMFSTAVNKYNYDAKNKYKPTLISAYNAMIMKHFSTVNSDGNCEPLPNEERPSYQRFYRWVRDNKLHGDYVLNHNVSARSRSNNNRLLVGNSNYGIHNPAEMVEIDETELSLCLVSANPHNPGQVLGHSVVYIAIDVLTYRIIGAAIGFRNNSYAGLLDLIDSMMMSDEENAAFLGVDYDSNMPVFPGCILPQEIRVDHGAEYTSHAISENLTGGKKLGTLEGIPITINLVPVAMGSKKGVAERFFGELHRRVQAALKSGAGCVTGTHDSKHLTEAVIMIHELRKIVYELLKEHNNSPIINYPVTPSIAANLDRITPNALWDYYAQTRLSGFDVSDEQMRNLARYGFMLRDRVFQLSRKQISYRNTLYWDIAADNQLVFDALKLGEKTSSIDVRYDPRSVNSLYRYDKKAGTIYRYNLAKKRPEMREFANMQWSVIDDWIDDYRSRRYEGILEKENSRIQTEAKIAAISERAIADRKGTQNHADGRREARKVEQTALSAYDEARKGMIFYGVTGDDGFDENLIPDSENISVVPIDSSASSDDKDAEIPTIDINDYATLAAAYGLSEED